MSVCGVLPPPQPFAAHARLALVRELLMNQIIGRLVGFDKVRERSTDVNCLASSAVHAIDRHAPETHAGDGRRLSYEGSLVQTPPRMSDRLSAA